MNLTGLGFGRCLSTTARCRSTDRHRFSTACRRQASALSAFRSP
jgi:hypothetical protein